MNAETPAADPETAVGIDLLGHFAVRLDDKPIPESAWTRRHVAGLVKLLALSPRRQVHREQVIHALWPDVPVADAAPRLHKAAHYARGLLGPDSVVLRHEIVQLFPNRAVLVDVDRFQELAAAAHASGDAAAAAVAAAAYPGPLLPDDPYESWLVNPREHLEQLHLRLLEQAQRFDQLVELDPANEANHVELIRQYAARGDSRAALRQFERMERALQRELGLVPSDDALALRDSLANPQSGGPRLPLVGRSAEIAALLRILDEAARGRGRTVFLSGGAGMGKSALADWMRDQAAGRQWRTGHGVASRIEGAWPYAPILEAVADLARRHPTLLDGLDDRWREDIDRALAGDPLEWNGTGSHQRLFVAVAEFIRVASAGRGLLLTIDGMHEADEASLRLVHYLTRSCVTAQFVLVVSYRRQSVTDVFEEVRSSLLGRGAATEIALGPLDREETAALIAACGSGPSDAMAQRIWEISGGIPFAITELARSASVANMAPEQLANAALGLLSPTVRTVLEHIAITGSTFDTDVFVALSGLAEDDAFDCLDAALAARLIERTRAGYQFRHPLIREALLNDIPAHHRLTLHRTCAERLIAIDASPAQIGHHLLAGGDARAAVPYVLRAAQTQAAVGAYRDALSLVDSIRTTAQGDDRARALALRADLLAAVGDQRALPAFREALSAATPDGRRRVQARMARIAIHSGDFDTARAALDGLEPDGGPDDSTILLARGNLAYFDGDLDQAIGAAERASRMLHSGDERERFDLIALKGLITHSRGEWSQLLRTELWRTRNDPGLATDFFDSHLCIAEYMLYGPTPYAEVMNLARTLRSEAERTGALRAVAFAGALLGEAALLAGDLDLAEQELTGAVDAHREIGATAGEAHSLQRLAEVRLARGDRDAARQLLRRALPLARWSPLSMHLMQRVYGTMVMAARDAEEGRAIVDAAEATLAANDFCSFCAVMLAVPAAIACADSGDLDGARHQLARAETSVSTWEGTAWQAALIEVRAHIAQAEGDPARAARLLDEAAQTYDASAQPLHAARCRAGLAVPSR